MSHLLEVRHLATRFHTQQGVVRAVNGISYTLDRGEAMALVGESGSGKSVSVLSILGLSPGVSADVAGAALLEGRDLLALPATELRRVRGRHIAMVFQDPATSLNPVLTVGYQLAEGLREHMGMSPLRARERATELLTLVGIPNPAERLFDYPNEFSLGQRQRIMIAMALACEPLVLIADEPTTALDVTIQAQIVDLVKRLQQTLGMAILWITHDLALVAGLVDKVAVMYAGFIVELSPVRDLFRTPRHPYTLGLLRAMPQWEGPARERLASIPGSPPDLREDFHSCPFAPRCAYVVERCRQQNPPLIEVGPGHRAACWRWEEM